MVFQTAITPTWYMYHGIYSLFFLPWEKVMLDLLCRTHTDIVECTLDTLNNWLYNNSCFPSKIVQVQSFCKISTFCYWLLVFLSTSSKCSLRQPNPGQRLWRLAWFGPFPHWVAPLCKKKPGYRPAEEEWLLMFPEGKNGVLKHEKFLTRDLSPVCGTLSAFGRGFFSHMFL